MSRTVLVVMTAVGAVLAALAGARFALGGLLRHEGAARVVAAPDGTVVGDGLLEIVPGTIGMAHVTGFGSRTDAVLSRAGVWMPFLLVAAVLAALAWQLGRLRDRLAWTDVLEPGGRQVVLALAVAAVGVVPGLAQTVAGAAVLRAGEAPAGYAPLPVDVDWGWFVAAALLLVGRLAVSRGRAPSADAHAHAGADADLDTHAGIAARPARTT